jgi:hypothetical protein
VLLSTGCVTTTFNTGRPGGGTKKTESATFFIGGLVGDKTVNLSELCPEGVASWKDYHTAVDAILDCITCSIYDPKTIEVECVGSGAPKTSYLLTPDAERHMTQVTRRETSKEASHD